MAKGQYESKLAGKVKDFTGEETKTEVKKKKGGRPSNGDVKKITLAIPTDLYESMEIGATLFFKGNKTAYINALIKKDLDENLDKYKEFSEFKKSL